MFLLKDLSNFFSLRAMSNWKSNKGLSKRVELLKLFKYIEETKIDIEIVQYFFKFNKNYDKEFIEAKKYLEAKGLNIEKAFQLSKFNLTEKELIALKNIWQSINSK